MILFQRLIGSLNCIQFQGKGHSLAKSFETLPTHGATFFDDR